MHKSIIILLSIAASIRSEVSSSYALLEKHSAFNPDIRTEPVVTHPVFKKETNDDEAHPVFRPEDHKRARIEMVKSDGAIKHDMLADQPQQQAPVDVNRADNMAIPNYAYVAGPVDVAYPDIPYAPGYGYENGYAGSSNYDPYGNGLTSYFLEPDTSAFSLLWSQVPDARAIAGFVGRTLAWVINSIFVLLIGSFVTVGICSYTNLCSITFHGVGPIHEEMRSLITPERLEKISTAADFVKTAIDKYQKIQKVTDGSEQSRRQ